MIILDSSISSSSGTAILHRSGTTTMLNSKIINNQYTGIRNGAGSKNFLITTSSIYGNPSYGGYSNYATSTAENNWWGDASGPYNAKYNPNGLGDPVNDYLDFTPWLNYDPNP